MYSRQWSYVSSLLQPAATATLVLPVSYGFQIENNVHDVKLCG